MPETQYAAANGLKLAYETFGSPTQPTCSAILTLLSGTNGYWEPGEAGWSTDIGGADEVHAEAGDDTVYGGVASDVLYGDANDYAHRRLGQRLALRRQRH